MVLYVCMANDKEALAWSKIADRRLVEWQHSLGFLDAKVATDYEDCVEKTDVFLRSLDSNGNWASSGLCRVDTKYIGGKKGHVKLWDLWHEYKEDRKAEWILYAIECPVARKKKSRAEVCLDWDKPYKHSFFVNAAWLDRLYLENKDRQIKLPISKDDGMMFGIAEAFEAGQAFEIDLSEARLKRN